MTANGSHSPGGLVERLMPLIWRRPPAGIAERTRRRVTLYLVPYLFFLYILAYLDRVNVSVAELSMERPVAEGGLAFSKETVGFGFGMFFLGYWILEIPSTVSVVRWGARWVFVRILILWGICAALVGAIGTPFASHMFSWLPHVAEHGALIDGADTVLSFAFGWLAHFFGHQGDLQIVSGVAHCLNGLNHSAEQQFYFFRFMLGFFEGGFFPSVIVYLSHWFRTEDRAKAIASFMAAIPLSSMLGLPLSGLLLNVHWLGLPGWRWIFILEGVLPVLAGFVTLFFLPDRPARAKWLPGDEREWLVAELEREHKGKQNQGHWAWVHHLGLVLLLTVSYFCLNITSYGLQSFMPGIIKSQSHVSNVFASVLAGLPYLMGFLGMLLNGWHSDRTGERYWHAALPMFLSSCGVFLAVALTGVPVLPVLVMIFCVGPFMYAHLPAYWPIPTKFLGATVAASAIGFINMIGNLGGQVGPYLVGKAAAAQTDFGSALLKIAPYPLVAAIIILVLAYTRPKQPNAGKSEGIAPEAGLTVSANPASAADRPGCEA
jgi:ACS family tartrate transporter-like MFS transporter